MRFPPLAFIFTLVMAVDHGRGDVITSEFWAEPELEEWTLLGAGPDLTTWAIDGVYYQDFENNCEPGDVCSTEAYRRSIEQFNEQPNWFYEYRVIATADGAEIPNGAPTVLAAANFFGNAYHCTVASDRIKLSGDIDLPILFLDVEEGVPHTIRLELFNDPPPATFHWYVDSELVLEGLADSPFPDFNSTITWQGRTWMQPTLNSWFYIRAGDIPIAGSADFNSDGEVDEFELFYIEECIERSASGEPADPSCQWSDINADNTVDCTDWQIIKNTLWTGIDDPPDLAACIAGPPPIPAVSHWGVVVLMLTLAISGSLVFSNRHRIPS